MDYKEFTTAEVLSVVTGVNLSTKGWNPILGHIMGEPMSDYGAIAVSKDARRFLQHKLPWTKGVKFPALSADISNESREWAVEEFLAGFKQYGDTHLIGQIHERATPLMAKTPQGAFIAGKNSARTLLKKGPGRDKSAGSNPDRGE